MVTECASFEGATDPLGAQPPAGMTRTSVPASPCELDQRTGRSFTDQETSEIRHAQQRGYRWTFLVSGLEHPKFTQIVADLTTAGNAKLAAAATALSTPAGRRWDGRSSIIRPDNCIGEAS